MLVTVADLQNERRVITATEAQQCLGIPASTIRSWAARNRIHPVHIEAGRAHARGYPLVTVLELAARWRRRTAHI